MNDLKKYVSKDGEYIVPVEWTVCSTVTVRGAKNLEDAIDRVRKNISDIPLSRNPDYIDESYTVSDHDNDGLIDAQNVIGRGVVMTLNGDRSAEYEIND